MEINFLENKDIPNVSKLWDEYYSHEFGLPDLTRTVTHAKVEENGKLIGFGMVKLWPEAIMILDQSQSKITQAKVMKKLMQYAIDACKHYNVEQLYATTVSTTIADLCRDHYEFKDLPRIVLVRSIT